MKGNPFQDTNPDIDNNSFLRTPQREAFKSISSLENDQKSPREVGIVMPVGCGKSGCITLAPFALHSMRTLVVAPNINIAKQLMGDFDPANQNMFYIKCEIIEKPPYPEPVEIRGRSSNLSDLEESDVVVTNIQQLQGENNRWLQQLPPDFFDLILFDEAHHNVASSWEVLRKSFPDARIINFSATPQRADGQLMTGAIIYSYPLFQAIQEGYVKRLKAIVLNPATLKYVRREDQQEIEVSLPEVYRLGEQDSGFRRSIVTSQETLSTIVDASIRELDRIREETSEKRHKIIASALNYEHCIQIVECYRSKGKRVGYVHSREGSAINDEVYQKLENHEIDVIVQVKKLGEGFDHPYLSVAAVFSIFRSLSPFVQFVGRIMRVIAHGDPSNIQNQGSVVFHAGANVARRWEDFQTFSQADQEYFDQLLPIVGLDFSSASEIEINPDSTHQIIPSNQFEVNSQTSIYLQEIPLLSQDVEAQRAFELLRSRGFTVDDYKRALELQPVPTTRVRERQAKRHTLDDNIKTATGKILAERKINPGGFDLDNNHLGRTNFVILKSAIDKKINNFVNRPSNQRSEFSRQELDLINENFENLINEIISELFDG